MRVRTPLQLRDGFSNVTRVQVSEYGSGSTGSSTDESFEQQWLISIIIFVCAFLLVLVTTIWCAGPFVSVLGSRNSTIFEASYAYTLASEKLEVAVGSHVGPVCDTSQVCDFTTPTTNGFREDGSLLQPRCSTIPHWRACTRPFGISCSVTRVPAVDVHPPRCLHLSPPA